MTIDLSEWIHHWSYREKYRDKWLLYFSSLLKILTVVLRGE